jgi:hypothetical protein
LSGFKRLRIAFGMGRCVHQHQHFCWNGISFVNNNLAQMVSFSKTTVEMLQAGVPFLLLCELGKLVVQKQSDRDHQDKRQ